MKKLKNKFNIYNVACGERISLIKLSRILNKLFNENKKLKIRFSNPRKGDIKHSIASIKKISDELGYSPKFNVVDGLRELKDL